jgi:dipeptidyl-peptidase-4
MVSTGNPRFDAHYSAFDSLTSGGVITPAWSPDGRSLAYVDGPADERRGWLVDTKSGERTELIDVTRVREAVRATTGETPPGRGLPFAEVRYTGPGSIGARVGSHVVTVDLATCQVSAEPVPHWYDTAHDSYFWRKVARFFADTLGEPGHRTAQR